VDNRAISVDKPLFPVDKVWEKGLKKVERPGETWVFYPHSGLLGVDKGGEKDLFFHSTCTISLISGVKDHQKLWKIHLSLWRNREKK
jgi:hypothetical protein